MLALEKKVLGGRAVFYFAAEGLAAQLQRAKVESARFLNHFQYLKRLCVGGFCVFIRTLLEGGSPIRDHLFVGGKRDRPGRNLAVGGNHIDQQTHLHRHFLTFFSS